MSHLRKLFGLGSVCLMILALSSLAFTVSLQGAAPGDVTVQVAKDAKLGDILTDGKGMTLYRFTQDQANVSNCSGGCATAWPPLVVAAGKAPMAGPGVTGKLGVITRQDGTSQVTYNGLPLYFFASDSKAGDTTGQGVGDVWFIVHPTDAAGAGQPTAAGQAPSVTVADQPITNDTVAIADVFSAGPGWIVIHADKSGSPGPVLGHAAVKDGDNKDVVVTLAAEGRTPTLYAMLHTDAGTAGTYEFPGADAPVTVNGTVVSPAFKATNVTAAAAATPAVAATEAMTPTVAATPMVAATVAATPTVATPAALPTTGGGDTTPWTGILLLAVGGLALIGGLSLAMSSRKR